MTDLETIGVYDASVARYAELAMPQSQIDALARFIAAVAPGGRVLDLGCGPGTQAKVMHEAGLQVDAIDASEGFVAAARALGVPARQARFEDCPGAQTYDGIWASFSLLHAPRDAVAGHIARLGAALPPGGQFFLGMKTGSGTARDPIGRFYSYFSAAELIGFLSDAGLTIDAQLEGKGKGLAGTDDAYIQLHATKHA